MRRAVVKHKLSKVTNFKFVEALHELCMMAGIKADQAIERRLNDIMAGIICKLKPLRRR